MYVNYICKKLKSIWFIQVPRRVVVRVQFLCREAIAEICKPVSTTIFIFIHIVPVLTAELLEHVEKVNAAAWVQGNHWSILLTIFKPRPTATGPSGPRHKGIDMLVELFNCSCIRRDGFDSFSLAFTNYARKVLGDVFRDGEYTSMAYRGAGAKKYF